MGRYLMVLALSMGLLASCWGKDDTGGVSTSGGRQSRPANLPDLIGEWFVADQSTALADGENRTSLTIHKVVAAPSSYNDGYFLCAWSGDTGMTKGFFSLKTGRIVLNTTRVVGGRRLAVQYSGRLVQQSGRSQWVGTAGAIGLSDLRSGEVRDWPFTATRQKKSVGR